MNPAPSADVAVPRRSRRCFRITPMIFGTISSLLLLHPLQRGVAQEASYSIRQYDLLITPDFATRRMSVRASADIENPGHDSVFVFGLNDRYEPVRIVLDPKGWILMNVVPP